LIQKTLMKLNSHQIYHKDSILVIEHNRREPLSTVMDGWNLIRQRRIGDTLISFLTPQGENHKTEVK
jgi:16S rRNA G966 N2-methylase RsmD